MPIVNNNPKRALFRTTASANVVVAGNSSVSNLATGNQEIRGATISQLFWTTDGQIDVARGSNTILTLSGSGSWNLRESGVSTLGEFPTTDVVITLTGNGSILVELTKLHVDGTYGSGYENTI